MNDPTPDITEMVRAEAGDALERIEATLLALEGGSAHPDAIDAMFRDAHSIKGTASMVGWTGVAAIARAMEDRLEACRERGRFETELADPMLRATDALRRALAGDAEAAAAVADELGDADAAAVTPSARSRPAEPAPTADRADAGLGKRRVAAAPGTPPRGVEGRAIRVAAEKIDRMLDAVGETVLHHRRLEHELGQRVLADGESLAEEELDLGERLLGELQDSVIEMRTLPLSSITAGYPRAVRDIAAADGKQVELVITGAETQLDRVILEGISDTITHLLRNAVAHGIESPDARQAAGKPRSGRIELRAEQREGMVAIEVADDGRGVSAELLASATDAESLTDLLTRPGFSTAAKVSDLAGRGVGLDAVKRNVEHLGGSLEVRSEPGQGANVIVLLPLTLALLRVLMCERGGQVFGVPLAGVREVVAVTDTVSMGGRPLLALRGMSVALSDLAAVMGASSPPLPPSPTAIVLALAGRVAAVQCDRVLGDQEVVMKSLGPLLAEVAGYLGAAILGDGRLVLILDPNHLLKTQAASPPPVRQSTGPGTHEAPNVLVVDDQFTVRELQRSILETAGYRVETAINGREALERIGRPPDVDMVLTDIQMPEMNGFELLKAIRRQPDRASLPVVIVTSLGAEEDRRRGAEEGADAYMAKDEFDQHTLLETVGRLVGR
ncbi:MAG TPA: response regulator [Baekduia sp.]|nr:response regulator [Baekduia sp.]